MRVRHIAISLVVLILACPAVADAYTVAEYKIGEPSEALKEQAQREAQEQKEANERAKAAEEKKATEERQQREAAEHQNAVPEAEHTGAATEPQTKKAASRCVVPALKGDSLSKAATALDRAHCKLGKVHGSHTGARVVVSQKVKARTKLAAGTAIGITLGSAKHPTP